MSIPTKRKRKRVSESGDDSDDEDYAPSGSRHMVKKPVKRSKTSKKTRDPSEEI